MPNLLSTYEINHLKNRTAIRMCVDPDWMPLESINAKGQHEGILADILSLVAHRIEKEIVLVQTRTWDESLAFARNRLCDIVSSAMATPERKKYLNFTERTFDFPLVIATREEYPFIEKIGQVLDKRLGIVKGYAHIELLKRDHPNIRLVTVMNMKEGLKRLHRGELYGMLDMAAPMNYQIRLLGFSELKINGAFDYAFNLSIAVRNDDPTLFQIINKATTSLDEAEIQSIYNKWIGMPRPPEIDYSLIWKIFAGIALLLCVIFFWNRRLAHLNKQIRKADQFKTAFLANMSHEIRTPVNAIAGLSELLLLTALTEKQQFYVTSISNSAQMLLEVLNDILDLSKIQAGKLSLETIPFDLKAIVDRTGGLIAARAERKGIKMMIAYPPDLPTRFLGDPIRIQQILLNLMGNAVKFTEKGYVKLAVNGDECPSQNGNIEYRLVFMVSDTGIGIAQDQFETIFEHFAQADASTTRQFGGTGLGLSICKELAELMGGGITVKSRSGEGSVFIFRLSLPEASSPKQDTKPLQRDESAARAETAASAEFPVPADRRPCRNPPLLLLVEDNAMNRKVAREILKRLGCDVDIAVNGKEAVDLTTARRYDLIILDMQMPVMDGFEAARIIRRRETRQKNRTPIIAMTAMAIQGDRERCIAAGVDEYVTKPVRTATFSRILQTYCPETVEVIKDLPASDMSVRRANDGEVVINPEILLDISGQDPEIIRLLVSEFMRDAPIYLEALKASLENANEKTVRRQLHRLQGLVAGIGGERAAGRLMDIHNSLKEGRFIPDIINIDALEANLEQLIYMLETTNWSDICEQACSGKLSSAQTPEKGGPL